MSAAGPEQGASGLPGFGSKGYNSLGVNARNVSLSQQRVPVAGNGTSFPRRCHVSKLGTPGDAFVQVLQPRA